MAKIFVLSDAFPDFNVHRGAPGTLGPRWEKWKAGFKNVLLAMDIKDKARKRVMLVHYVGSAGI